MTAFPASLTSPQLETARTSGWWARVLACLNSNEIVFQAQAAESIIVPFITFQWDTATIGAYTDVWEGMVCFISSTTDLRDVKYRGRVRLAPSATQFFIDENATLLDDNDIITVIRDVDLFTRIRRDTLVDGSITFHKLPDVLAGLPSAIVLYDADNDGEEDYVTVQTPIHVDADSTSTTTWAWSVSGAGTSAISNAAIQNPTITFEAGYHYLIRVVHTNNLSVVNYQIAHVYAVTRTFSAPAVTQVVAGSVQLDGDDGNTATLTGYAQVSTLLDRTHVAVWSIEHFGDNSDTPLVSNVLMNGRIRSDSIQTEGSAEAGRLQQVTFQVEGITAYLRRLRIPNDIIRPDSTPTAWGEIEQPNPYRMAIYALWVYTTLTNICSVSVEDGAFDAWQIGAEPRGIDGGYALDVLMNILDTIHAAPNYSPSGEIHLAQTVSFKADRSGVALIMTFGLGDQREYTMDRDSSKTIAQTVAFGGVFNSSANTIILYTAQAPSIVYGDGAETRELTREILTANSTADDAAIEIGLRASNDFAFNNPKLLLRQSLYDSFAGVLIPTNFQRWSSVIPASSNPLAIALGSTDYFQLQSVTLGINADGSIDVSGEWYEETSFDDAQVLAALLPNNLSNMNPTFPILPNDPAFPTDPLEGYPTDTPTLDELAPVDPDSASQAYTPWPPDVAAQVGQRQGSTGCNVLQLLFSNTSNTTSSWLTTNTVPYLLTAEGFAEISEGFEQCFNLAINDGGWFAADFTGAPNANFGFYDTGVGLAPEQTLRQFFFAHAANSGVSADSVTITFNEAQTTFVFGRIGGASVTYSGAAVLSVTFDSTTDPSFFPFDMSFPFYVTTPTSIVPTTTFRVTDFCFNAGGSAEPTYADTFYSFNLGAEDTPEAGEPVNAQALGPSEGLLLDNSLYTPVTGIPPFDPSHRYADMPFTGTGNVLLARMVFAGYTSAQRAYLTLTMCRIIT